MSARQHRHYSQSGLPSLDNLGGILRGGTVFTGWFSLPLLWFRQRQDEEPEKRSYWRDVLDSEIGVRLALMDASLEIRRAEEDPA